MPNTCRQAGFSRFGRHIIVSIGCFSDVVRSVTGVRRFLSSPLYPGVRWAVFRYSLPIGADYGGVWAGKDCSKLRAKGGESARISSTAPRNCCTPWGPGSCSSFCVVCSGAFGDGVAVSAGGGSSCVAPPGTGLYRVRLSCILPFGDSFSNCFTIVFKRSGVVGV